VTAITARHRLGVLTSLRLVDRFRPYREAGSAPWHYVLDVLGAAVAWEDDETARASWRRDKALAIATSSRLGHLVGTNGFFTALIRIARRSSGRCRLRTWRSERGCTAEWGDLVRPDGFGEWAEGGVDVQFFVEWDMGTERVERLAGKLPGYGDLAAVLGNAAWVLFAFPTPRRENAARSSLKAPVPVATAVLGQGESPAGPVWLPLDERRRRRLVESRECAIGTDFEGSDHRTLRHTTGGRRFLNRVSQVRFLPGAQTARTRRVGLDHTSEPNLETPLPAIAAPTCANCRTR
jgi:hypothetical protein